MSKRILFLYTALQVGGAERHLALLVLALRDRGFEPVVATLRGRGRFFEELHAADVRSVFVDMRSRWDLRGALRAYRLWRLRPDIVVTVSIDAQVIGQAIAERARARHVTMEHGGAGIHRGLHRELLTMLVARRVDEVVAVSASQMKDLRRLGFRDESIRIVPNGTPRLPVSRSAAETRQELGLDEDAVVALLVAGLRPEKRPDVFVDAVARAHAADPRIRGIVVGGGRLLGDIRRRADATDGAVRVLGERSDVADLICASDAVCFSSDVEALPVAALEAMSLGKPIVATDVGGLQDAVVPGETGWLVPPRDPAAFAVALLEVANDPAAAAERGRRGYSRYEERFTVESMVERYVALLSDADGGATSAR
jgi:glycosyltransferase involved in cell wall biosynthesis